MPLLKDLGAILAGSGETLGRALISQELQKQRTEQQLLSDIAKMQAAKALKGPTVPRIQREFEFMQSLSPEERANLQEFRKAGAAQTIVQQPVPAGIVDRVSAARRGLRSVNKLKELLKSRSGFSLRFNEKIAGFTDPALDATFTDFIANKVRAISGVAARPDEIERQKRTIANFFSSNQEVLDNLLREEENFGDILNLVGQTRGSLQEVLRERVSPGEEVIDLTNFKR